MNDSASLKIDPKNLISVIQYARLVGKTRGRIYQLIDDEDERIKIVKIANKTFVDITKSERILD